MVESAEAARTKQLLTSIKANGYLENCDVF